MFFICKSGRTFNWLSVDGMAKMADWKGRRLLANFSAETGWTWNGRAQIAASFIGPKQHLTKRLLNTSSLEE